MTAANILLYVALIGYMVYRRIQGRPVESVKALLVLPVILGIIGWQDVEHAHHLDNIDITVSVIGCAISLALGAVRGVADKISERDGVPWVQWSVTSIVVFAINIVAKLALDAGGVALGGTSKGVTSSLLLAVALMLIGESLVILYRVQGFLPWPTVGPNGGGNAGTNSGGAAGPATAPRPGSGWGGPLGGGLLGASRSGDRSDQYRSGRDRRHGRR